VIYDEADEVIDGINNFDRPLALYIFSNDKKFINRVFTDCRFGGGCINDVIIHLATERMGFGGVGESGMGSYHGENGFRAFSHYKSIVDKKTWLDLPMRYQPYDSFKEKLVRMFLK
ncbi:MAG: aldehyde dehydrogenase family protein, partial [Clostridia bacterium]|nr:aldehyde dehydrogenase family protein [Clostridia bacterium]